MSQLQQNYPNPEVQPKVLRRTFSLAYKQRILQAAAACKHGEVGGLLRREGLYASTLSTWRKEAEAGTLGGKQRGRSSPSNTEALKRLQAENARLKQKLEQAETIIEAQKKLARLLDSLREEAK